LSGYQVLKLSHSSKQFKSDNKAGKLNTKGFTLIELLVSVSIMVVAIYLLIVILTQNNVIFFKQRASFNQGMSLNDASGIISDSIKQSSSIAVSSPTIPIYSTSVNSLVLQVPAIDNAGNVISNVYDYFVIAADNTIPTVLRLQVFPTSPSTRKNQNRVLATNLSTIRFLYLNPSGVQVSPVTASKINYTINLKDRAGLNSQQSSIMAEINLRNN